MLTLAAHVLFIALLLLEKRLGTRELPPPQHPPGQWITLSFIPPPPPEPEDETEPPEKPRPDAPAPRISRPERPSTAITLPTPSVAPVAPVGPAPRAAPTATEWREQAAELAARYAKEAENPATFSGPVQAMREPCKPRKVSMFPKKKEPVPDPPSWSEVGPTTMVGGMPIGVIGGSLNGGRVGGVGISLPLGKPEPNKHLFDDMMEGKTPASSVPHHERCD